MIKTLPRVIYLASTNIGHDLLAHLQSYPCEIVLAVTDNRKVTEFPLYDLGISFLYTHRIPASEFVTPYKWVNFHPGPLPEYRGRNIAYHAIMGRSPFFGATIHYMDAEFDTGEIIEVVRFPVEDQHTAGKLVDLANTALVELFKKYVAMLLQGKVASYPQPVGGTYYRKTLIDDYVELTPDQQCNIRALTVRNRFYAKLNIGGQQYIVLPQDESL